MNARKLIAGQLDAAPTAYITLAIFIITRSDHRTVRFEADGMTMTRRNRIFRSRSVLRHTVIGDILLAVYGEASHAWGIHPILITVCSRGVFGLQLTVDCGGVVGFTPTLNGRILALKKD